MNNQISALGFLGYNEFYETHRKKLGLEGFPVARVIAEHKGSYIVRNADGEYRAKITGKQMYAAASREDFPAVGDWVSITRIDAGTATIKEILPRRGVIKRNSAKGEIQVIAANIDVVFAVEALNRDFNLNRLERYFTLAADGGAKPAVILNKTDLVSSEELDLIMAQLRARLPHADIIATSTISEKGLKNLKSFITPGLTYCFLGSSGVGKSSLINILTKGNNLRTREISARSDRGKHVTTSRQIYFLDDGGIVIDNPGMREVGMADVGMGVQNVFEEIAELAGSCRFADCTHTHEPGCAVLEAVTTGGLDQDKYNNYLSLKKEAEFYELTKLEKREKDKRFGKFVKKALEQKRRYE